MKKYSEMTREELQAEKDRLQARYDKYMKQGLSLNMARGKPSIEQEEASIEMLDIINGPIVPVNLDEVVRELCSFNGNLVIQSMFLSGEKDGVPFDNSAEPNLSAWLDKIQLINPRKVMIYSLDREAPATKLHKFDKEKLEEIASLVRKLNIPAETY